MLPFKPPPLLVPSPYALMPPVEYTLPSIFNAPFTTLRVMLPILSFPSTNKSLLTLSVVKGACGVKATRSFMLVPLLPLFHVGSKNARYAPRFFSLMINDVGSA